MLIFYLILTTYSLRSPYRSWNLVLNQHIFIQEWRWLLIFMLISFKSENELPIIVVCWAVSTVKQMCVYIFFICIFALPICSLSIHLTNSVNTWPNVCFVFSDSVSKQILYSSFFFNVKPTIKRFKYFHEKNNDDCLLFF